MSTETVPDTNIPSTMNSGSTYITSKLCAVNDNNMATSLSNKLSTGNNPLNLNVQTSCMTDGALQRTPVSYICGTMEDIADSTSVYSNPKNITTVNVYTSGTTESKQMVDARLMPESVQIDNNTVCMRRNDNFSLLSSDSSLGMN